jgi:hypothetical protein
MESQRRWLPRNPALREARVKNHRASVGVVEQIDQLRVDIAIVDVERGGPCLERAEHPFEIFVAVVEIEPDVILTGFPVLENGAFDATPETVAAQQIC